MEKGKVAAIVILILLVLGQGAYIVYDKVIKDEDKEEGTVIPSNTNTVTNEEKELEEGTFKITGVEDSVGTLQVEGYAVVEEIKDCGEGPEEACTDEHIKDVAVFNVTRIENQDFLRYINERQGIETVAEYVKTFPMGCVENNVISYNTHSETDYKEVTLTTDVSSKILNSTKEKPIILDLKIVEITGGFGVNACFTLPATIEIAE